MKYLRDIQKFNKGSMDTIAFKEILAYLLYHAGIPRILSCGYRESVILAYHHVIPDDDEMISFLQPGMYVTTKTFERHIRYISEKYTVIALEELGDLQTENSCIITFDDGWADNYHYAFPILAKYGVPATVFISTNYIGSSKWPWPDKVSYYAAKASQESFKEMVKRIAKERTIEGGILDEYTLYRFNGQRIAAEELITHLKQIPLARLIEVMMDIDAIHRHLFEKLQARTPWMTWDEIRNMHLNGISFGAHTHNHVILTSCNHEIAEREIIDSKKILSERLGESVNTFSYPNGDYCGAHVDILKRHGFTHAVTTRSGNTKDSADFLTLRRFMLHNDMTRSIPMFACKLTGKIPYF